MLINKKYKYFAFIPKINKIVNGWEIVDDVESLKYYAHIDMADNEYKKNQYKLLSANGLLKMGIDPYNSNNWATSEQEKSILSGTMTRLKKGSKEAKAFMAKLRASKKGAVKKAKAVKKTVKTKLKKYKAKAHSIKKSIFSGDTHTDTKSHNYRINISGLKSEYMEVSQKLDLFALDIALLKKQARETKGKYNKKALNDTARDMQKKYIALKKYQKTLI